MDSKDKKYEVLKARYWLMQRNMKALMEKYTRLKSDVDKHIEINNRLQQMQQRGPSRSLVYVMEQTPSDSGISIPSTR